MVYFNFSIYLLRVMRKIFLSYHFDPDIQLVARKFERLICSHDLQVVDGQRLGGQILIEGVKNNIQSCDAMVLLLTTREDGKSNDWVKHERSTAFNLNIPFVAVIEAGVGNTGPFEKFEYIDYHPAKLEEPLLKISETIYKWKTEIGEMIEAYLEPNEISNAIRENIDKEEIVRYRFFDRYVQWSAWKKPTIRLTAGGISLYMDGVKKDSELQVEVRTSNKSWSSDVVNRNLRIVVR